MGRSRPNAVENLGGVARARAGTSAERPTPAEMPKGLYVVKGGRELWYSDGATWEEKGGGSQAHDRLHKLYSSADHQDVDASVALQNGQALIWDATANKFKPGTAGGGGTQATEAAPGIAEIATDAEVDAYTDDLRIVTPKKLARARRPIWLLGPAGYAVYNIALSAGTWTRLPNPRITVPVIGTAPPGAAWYVVLEGFLRIVGGPAAMIYLGAQLNNGSMGGVNGGGFRANSGEDLYPFSSAIPAPANTSVGFSVDFAIYSTTAGTYTISPNPDPYVEIKAVQT